MQWFPIPNHYKNFKDVKNIFYSYSYSLKTYDRLFYLSVLCSALFALCLLCSELTMFWSKVGVCDFAFLSADRIHCLCIFNPRLNNFVKRNNSIWGWPSMIISILFQADITKLVANTSLKKEATLQSLSSSVFWVGTIQDGCPFHISVTDGLTRCNLKAFRKKSVCGTFCVI